MNILVVYQHYYPEPFRINDLCESLVSRGHNVTVLTGIPNYPEGHFYDGYKMGVKNEEILKGVKIMRCSLLPRGKSKFTLSLNYISFALSASIKALKLKNDYDVVFAQQTSPVLMILPAIVYKIKYHKKMLLYCLDPWPDSLAAGGIKEGSLVFSLFQPISKWIYNAADCLMVSSYGFIDYFQETFGFEKSRIRYLPQYAEDLFLPDNDHKRNDQLNLVFAGNIGKAQGVDTIVKAAGLLKNYPNFVFHIVGSGSDLEACKGLANEIKINNLIFHGRRPLDEMPKYYSMADAMLLTLKDQKSFSLTLPGKVQSYMAAGKAIIAAANGETRRVIEEAKCGICCAAEDYQAYAETILEFYQTKNREHFGKNARAYYEQHFSKEQFMIKLEKALTELGEQDFV